MPKNYPLEDDSGGQNLGRLLGAWRRKHGTTQRALAERLAMSGPNLSRIEHGADFRVSTLMELARQLKLEPVLVPKAHVRSVRALIDDAERDGDETAVERGRFT